MKTLLALLPALALGLATEKRDTTSNITSEQAQFFQHLGSKRVSIDYGPYTVPPRSQMDGMKSFTTPSVQMPCTDCLITFMQADLHYPNGTKANTNTGLWLHHTVLANTAAQDLVCAGSPQRMFASGNERTPFDFCVNGYVAFSVTKIILDYKLTTCSTLETGYYIPANGSFGAITELMNMMDMESTGIVSITYEYIPSPPPSFGHLQPLWLDIGPGGGCKGSDVPAFANKAFHYSSPAWKAPTDGYVVAIGSHLHDGGTQVKVKNNGNVVCDAVARYGQSAAYIDTMPMNMTMNGMQMEKNMTVEHISSIKACYDAGSFKAGDEWSLTAYYNTSEYMPMQNTDGSLETIMGISLVYFVEGDYANATNGSHLTGKPTGQTAKVSTTTSDGVPSMIPTARNFWSQVAVVLGLVYWLGL